MVGPESEYERHGDVDDVVFPCGYTLGPDGDSINLYYGAADCAIALAQGSVRAAGVAGSQWRLRAPAAKRRTDG